MKKLYILSVLLLQFVAFVNAQTWPCTPAPQLTWNGIYPETLPDGMAGYEYWNTLTFQIPRDSSINGISVTVDSAKFLYATGKPAGFNFTCDRPSCSWAGGQKGCALFNGFVDSTFTDSVAEFPMKIYTLTWFRFTGAEQQFSRIDSATNYKFRIRKYNSIGEISQYEALSVYPNPTNGMLNIDIRDNNQLGYTLLVIDALGKTVYAKSVNENSFLSTLNIDISTLPKGLYTVTLQAGNAIKQAKVSLH
jgi:hypothetical protein